MWDIYKMDMFLGDDKGDRKPGFISTCLALLILAFVGSVIWDNYFWGRVIIVVLATLLFIRLILGMIEISIVIVQKIKTIYEKSKSVSKETKIVCKDIKIICKNIYEAIDNRVNR